MNGSLLRIRETKGTKYLHKEHKAHNEKEKIESMRKGKMKVNL